MRTTSGARVHSNLSILPCALSWLICSSADQELAALLIAQRQQATRQNFRPVFSEDALCGGVDVNNRVVVRSDQDNGVLALLEDLPQALFTLMQGRLGLDMLLVFPLEAVGRILEIRDRSWTNCSR